MLKTYISATLGDITTNVIFNGVSQLKGPTSIINTTLHGMQTGTCFIAFPIAQHLLDQICKESPKLKQIREKGHAVDIAITGTVAAAVVTVMNLPLHLVQEKVANNKDANVTAKDIGKMFFSQIGPNIGFPLTASFVDPLLPIPQNSIIGWARGHLLTNTSAFGATLLSIPSGYLLNGINPMVQVKGFFKGIVSSMVLQDSTEHFMRIAQSI